MSFDAQSFLDATTTDSNATSLDPIPEYEYSAVITDVDVASGISQKNDQPWTRLDLKVEIQDPLLAEKLNRVPVSKMGIMLDTTEGGGLATGPNKNVTLGRVREALGLNQPGQPFSPRMMIGRQCKVAIKHREYNGQIFDEVRSILKAA